MRAVVKYAFVYKKVDGRTLFLKRTKRYIFSWTSLRPAYLLIKKLSSSGHPGSQTRSLHSVNFLLSLRHTHLLIKHNTLPHCKHFQDIVLHICIPLHALGVLTLSLTVLWLALMSIDHKGTNINLFYFPYRMIFNLKSVSVVSYKSPTTLLSLLKSLGISTFLQ